MPELPDILCCLHALEQRVVGQRLEGIRVASPFVLRTVAPPLSDAAGRNVAGLRRLGKRIVLELEGGLFVIIHLMIAGRLRWRDPGARLAGKMALAALDFAAGALVLTEAATKKRAGLWLVQGEEALREHDPGGLEVLESDAGAFAQALRRENHTLKRALTDPRLFSGIGSAYSDEILHRARLSPLALTSRLSQAEAERLHVAATAVLQEWTDRLQAECGAGFPERVTAFREGMAVHGRHGKPCPDCGQPVQRIVYAESECCYCPGCQTGGRLLADRSLSRLLRSDWPRTLADLEERKRRGREGG